MVNAISEHVFGNFQSSLDEIAEKYKNDPYERIIELGKKYVSFMVENPDYLKFVFLTKFEYGITIERNKFKNCALDSLKSINAQEEYVQDIIAMWSMVHGIATMLAYKTVLYEGDYLELVEKILRKNLNF